MAVKRFLYSLLAFLLILAIGVFSYHYLEGWNYTDSLYFSVSTMSTVGYGDFHPTSQLSKLFSVAFMLVGIPVFLATIGSFGVVVLSYETSTLQRVFARVGIDGKGRPRRRRR